MPQQLPPHPTAGMADERQFLAIPRDYMEGARYLSRPVTELIIFQVPRLWGSWNPAITEPDHVTEQPGG